MTTSLRGVSNVVLNVQMLEDGIHSGNSGIPPSSFRICRQLLSRVEDEKTGLVVPKEFWTEIPESRLSQVSAAGEILGDMVVRQFPFVEGGHPVAKDAPISEHILARTWRPALSVTGADGLPATGIAGNVMLPYTNLKLSMRLPPTLDATQAAKDLERILTADPPQGAHVSVEHEHAGNGWHAPLEAEWLNQAVHTASLTYFDRPCAHLGEGGSIPFMGMVSQRSVSTAVICHGQTTVSEPVAICVTTTRSPSHRALLSQLLDMFPKAQFLVTGAAGPGNNMHAPNENLHIDYSARLAMCVSQIVGTLATIPKGGAEGAEAGAAGQKPKSFLDSFQQSGGDSQFFVGCDCGTAGCVIFDQGKERPAICPVAS